MRKRNAYLSIYLLNVYTVQNSLTSTQKNRVFFISKSHSLILQCLGKIWLLKKIVSKNNLHTSLFTCRCFTHITDISFRTRSIENSALLPNTKEKNKNKNSQFNHILLNCLYPSTRNYQLTFFLSTCSSYTNLCVHSLEKHDE